MTPKEAYDARKVERTKLKDMEYQLKTATEGLMMLDTFDRLATAFERIADVLENPRTTFDPR